MSNVTFLFFFFFLHFLQSLPDCHLLCHLLFLFILNFQSELLDSVCIIIICEYIVSPPPTMESIHSFNWDHFLIFFFTQPIFMSTFHISGVMVPDLRMLTL